MATFWLPAASRAGEREPPMAQVAVHAGRAGCAVDLDSAPVGETELSGNLTLPAVEPGDHYIHVRCPNEHGKGYFLSPRAGDTVRIAHGAAAAAAGESASTPQESGQVKVRLRRHIEEAVQDRARGRIEEAIRHLREAYRLDPENSDLHREMGITFLLAKEWKRARLEMLEAIRYDPNDADAHNGLGYALEKLGKLEEALREYRAATRLEPDDPNYRRHYLDALARLAAKQPPANK